MTAGFSSRPLVDVIVPIFGVERYIDGCLASLARQDYGPFRVLMIDDGSRDRSGLFAARYAERDGRFVYVRQENRGAGMARNEGLARAEGDLVMFVDADDWVEPDFVSSMVTAIGDAHDLAACNFTMYFPSGHTQHGFDPTVSDEDGFTHATRTVTEVYPWNKIYRRRAFGDADRFQSITYEDFGLIPSMVGRARSIGRVAASKYNYVVRHGSATDHARRPETGAVVLDIFAAYEQLKARRDVFLDRRWDDYQDLFVPCHLFTFRVATVHEYANDAVRTELARQISRRLNATFPGWSKTTAIRSWIAAEPNPAYRLTKQLVIRSYETEHFDLLFAIQRWRNRVKPRALTT